MNPIPVTPHTAKNRAIELGAALVGGYLMFSPVWAPSVTPEIYDRARIFQLVLLWALSAVLLVPGVSTAVTDAWRMLGRKAQILVAVFLGGGVVSAALSGAPHVGTLQVGLMALLLGVTLVTSASLRASKQRVETILAFCVAAGAALFVLDFWVTYVIFHMEGKPFTWAPPFFNFANIRFFGHYQSYALLLITLPLVMFRPGPAWRALFYLFAASFWSFQWVLGSRAVWAGFAVAVLVVCLFARNGRLKWLRQQGLLVLLGGLMSLWFQIPGTTHIPSSYSVPQGGNSSVNERAVLAQSAIEMIKRTPWTGVGPGQFGLNYSATRHAHPHNAPLQWLSEYGLVSGTAAIALLVMLLAFGLRKLQQTTRENADAVQMSLMAALVMGSVDSMFSGNLTMPHSQVLFFVLAGWIFGRNLPEHSPAGISASGVTRTVVTGVIVLASLTTLVLALEYLDVVENVRGAAVVRIPSFWQSGRFEAW